MCKIFHSVLKGFSGFRPCDVQIQLLNMPKFPFVGRILCSGTFRHVFCIFIGMDYYIHSGLSSFEESHPRALFWF